MELLKTEATGLPRLAQSLPTGATPLCDDVSVVADQIVVRACLPAAHYAPDLAACEDRIFLGSYKKIDTKFIVA